MGLFDRLYMGKGNKPDFTPEHLPTNRIQLFFEMLKINYLKLLGINLLFDVFMIPVFIWIMMNVQQIALMGEQFVLEGYHNFFFLALVPLAAIGGPAYAAMTMVCRKWARDDHAYVWSDFWDGFKNNWKQGLAVMFASGIALFGCYFAQQYYGAMVATSMLFIVLQMIMLLMTVLIFLMTIYIWPMLVTYEMTFKQLVVNSAIIAIGRLPFTLLFGVLTLLPLVLVAFVHPLIALYYPLCGFALTAFINASYVNGVFDKYLNPRIEGAEIGRGLRKQPEWENEEIDK